MELKNMMKNNLDLLIYNLKNKKNWFLVSFIIMVITLIIMPIILGTGYNEGILIFGILEIGTLLSLNAFIDFSFYHDNRKLTYYLSKPVTRMARINSLILSNLVYLLVLLLFLVGIGFFSGILAEDIKMLFTPAVPWLIIEIFVIALSASLTGNIISAGIASIINFTLPLSILAIIYYGFEVIGHFALGFNPMILFNTFIDNIYRIDILYFIKYINDFSLDYFLVLALWLILVYALTIYNVKKRKNERTGEFIVSDGYKNMISILLASLVPIGFSEVFYNTSIAGRITSFILLSGLTYYLINAILEKSFKIKRSAIKVFVSFIIFFGFFVFGTNIAANKFETKVPLPEEISSVYFESDSSVLINMGEYQRYQQIYNVDEKDIAESSYAILYTDKENIENIINFHKEVIENQDYYHGSSFNIVYFYNNGERIYRYYNLKGNETYDKGKDHFLKEIVKSKEFKEKKLPFVYDDDFFKNMKISDFRISFESEDGYEDLDIKQNEINMDILRAKLERDYNTVFYTKDNNLRYILMDRYGYFYYQDDYNHNEVAREIKTFIINFDQKIGNRGRSDNFSIRITEEFKETYEFLDALRNNDIEKLDKIIQDYTKQKENTPKTLLSEETIEILV